MKQRAIAFFAVVALLSMVGAAGAAVAPYAQDFEGLTQSDPAALTNDGWLIFGNVFDSGGNYLYGYGVFGAPNDGAAFSAIVAEINPNPTLHAETYDFAIAGNAGVVLPKLVESLAT